MVDSKVSPFVQISSMQNDEFILPILRVAIVCVSFIAHFLLFSLYQVGKLSDRIAHPRLHKWQES